MTRVAHDIERLIERSSTLGKDEVPLLVRRAAFAAVAGHPNFTEALNHPVCYAVIMIEAKSFFDELRWPHDVKALVLQQLSDANSVLLLSFMTSDVERTDDFTGGGVTYDFVIHPVNYKVVHAAFGSWRA